MPRPDKKLTALIGSKRYRVETAALIAHDLYLDERGQGYDRDGLNTFLYRTPKGAFFSVVVHKHSDRRPVITPLGLDDAIELYNRMRKDQRSPFAEAFPGVAITDA